MKWFQRGKLWESPEAAREAFQETRRRLADAIGDPEENIEIRESTSKRQTRAQSGSSSAAVSFGSMVAQTKEN